jgi:hypothetical protein
MGWDDYTGGDAGVSIVDRLIKETMMKKDEATKSITAQAKKLGAKILQIQFVNNGQRAIIAARWPAKATPFVVWGWHEVGGLSHGRYVLTEDDVRREFSSRLEGELVTAIFREDPFDRVLIAAERLVALYAKSEHDGESWGTEGAADRRVAELQDAVASVRASEVGC